MSRLETAAACFVDLEDIKGELRRAAASNPIRSRASRSAARCFRLHLLSRLQHPMTRR